MSGEITDGPGGGNEWRKAMHKKMLAFIGEEPRKVVMKQSTAVGKTSTEELERLKLGKVKDATN